MGKNEVSQELNNTTQLKTKLGNVDIDTEKVLFFPKGLIGYSSHHYFTLLQARPKSALLVLQDIKNDEVSFLVADPYAFLNEYEVKLSDKEQAIINAKDSSQISIVVTASIPTNRPDILYLNLNGPIFINHEERLALQVIQAESNFPHKLKLQIKEQVSNAEKLEIVSSKVNL